MEWMLMPLKRYADFSGRSRRMEFWMWIVFQFLIGCAFAIVMFAVAGGALMSGDPTQLMAMSGVVLVLYVLNILLWFIFLIPNLAVTVRRLHDTNRSGWWILAFWGPYFLSLAATISGISAAATGSESGATLAMVGGIGSLVAIVFALVLLVFMFLEGTRGPNRFGADPKGQDAGQVFA